MSRGLRGGLFQQREFNSGPCSFDSPVNPDGQGFLVLASRQMIGEVEPRARWVGVADRSAAQKGDEVNLLLGHISDKPFELLDGNDEDVVQGKQAAGGS